MKASSCGILPQAGVAQRAIHEHDELRVHRASLALAQGLEAGRQVAIETHQDPVLPLLAPRPASSAFGWHDVDSCVKDGDDITDTLEYRTHDILSRTEERAIVARLLEELRARLQLGRPKQVVRAARWDVTQSTVSMWVQAAHGEKPLSALKLPAADVVARMCLWEGADVLYVMTGRRAGGKAARDLHATLAQIAAEEAALAPMQPARPRARKAGGRTAREP